jgi:hypothetical protein
MKKIALFLILNFLVFNACRKNESTFPDCGTTSDLYLTANDVFIFGSTGGFGGGGMGVYKMKNGQLFRVLSNRDTLLSNDLFLQTQPLMTAFPKDLKDNPNQQSRGNCRDTFTFFAEIHLANGTKQSWYIDLCENTEVSSAGKCYVAEIGRLSSLLLQK